MSVIIYQEHIEELERELIQAKEEIVFLKELCYPKFTVRKLLVDK